MLPVCSRISHTGAQPKWIGIQHRVIGIDHLSKRTAMVMTAVRLARRRYVLGWQTPSKGLLVIFGPAWRLLVRLIASKWWRIRPLQSMGGCGSRLVIGGVGVGLIKHRSRFLRVVLLFCTHGINLGRTQFYQDVRGQLAELIYVLLKGAGIEGGWRLSHTHGHMEGPLTCSIILVLSGSL
jgi:hypothetical protein